MLDSLLVRIIVIVYLIVVLFTLLLLWKNSAAPDALKNGGILIASLLPVLIAVLPYLNRQIQKTNFSYNLFYDNTQMQLIPGEGHNSYVSAYIHAFSNLNSADFKGRTFEDFSGSKGFDLIEKGILSKLVWEFGNAWDIKKVSHSLPNAQATFFDSQTSLPSSTVTVEKVLEKFTKNHLLARSGVLVGKGLTLPGKSTLNTSSSNDDRVIKICNPQFDISIRITQLMSGVLQQGIPGFITKDPKNENRYYSISFGVEITMTSGILSRYSPQMPAYQRFYENICAALNTMDWKEIEVKLEKSLLDKAVDKILQH